MAPWWLVACVSGGDPSPEDSDPLDTDGIVDTDEAPDTAVVDHRTDARTVAGGATWHVDYDAVAEAAGFADCDYHRSWTAGVEIGDVPWLCPTCDAMFQANAAVDAGAACYATLTQGATAAPIEYLGFDDAGWYRASAEGYALTLQGTASADGDQVTWTFDTDYATTDAQGNTWNATFHVEGTAAIGATQADILRGQWPPESYTCGWPSTSPPPWTGDFVVEVGDTLPDGVFTDACGDAVRLHDLLGQWLVVDVSAMDCPPCQAMARDTPAALAALADEGIAARSVTLLAPSLSDPFAEPTIDELVDWTATFGLEDPVLADRGYGAWVLMSSYDAVHDDDAGYPTWYVIDPDGQIVASNSGYGSWDAIADILRTPR